jgi:hypothetical protein
MAHRLSGRLRGNSGSKKSEPLIVTSGYAWCTGMYHGDKATGVTDIQFQL